MTKNPTSKESFCGKTFCKFFAGTVVETIILAFILSLLLIGYSLTETNAIIIRYFFVIFIAIVLLLFAFDCLGGFVYKTWLSSAIHKRGWDENSLTAATKLFATLVIVFWIIPALMFYLGFKLTLSLQ